MMEFAVAVKDIDTGNQCRWVLDIDRERDRFLVAFPDNIPHWVPFADCKIARVVGPDDPRPRVMLQGQMKEEGSGLSIVKLAHPGQNGG